MPRASWNSGTVDPRQEHFVLCERDRRDPIARVGRGAQPDTFVVQFLPAPHLDREAYRHVCERVQHQVGYYLVELGEPDPWRYARYHASGTAANLYSDIRWDFIDPARR